MKPADARSRSGTRRYRLAYGKTGLEFGLPDSARVTLVEPTFVPGLPDAAAALRQALRQPIGSPPLRARVRAGQRVAIVFNDITRHTPSPLLLGALRSELEHIPDQDILLFNATGTHRANTPDELGAMLSPAFAEGYRIVQNDCRAPADHVLAGRGADGGEIWLHRDFMACDLRILTGFIEPHLFAGFSGGGKAFLPGLARLDTILHNHSPHNIGHPRARWGLTDGNPIWQAITAAVELVEPAFLLNICLNRERQITRLFAGDVRQAHRQGCAFARATAMTPVDDEPFDIVIGCNAGYPLDLNVYQAVKGMSAAAQIVRPGGAIIVAAECWDGIPEDGEYARMLRSAADYPALLEAIRAPGAHRPDGWQVLIQAEIALRCELYLYSHRLTPEQIESARLRPCASIEATVEDLLRRFGPQSRIAVMPEGPLAAPYLRSA